MEAASSSDMAGGTITQSPGWRNRNEAVPMQSAAGMTAANPLGCVSYLPVGRCGHPPLRCELEGVEHPQELVKVASCAGWVEQWQLQPLVGAYDKHLHRIQTKRQWAFSSLCDKGWWLNVCVCVWASHSGRSKACHLCPSHLGPACPGLLPAPVCCLLWWERAASRSLTPHCCKPGCPNPRREDRKLLTQVIGHSMRLQTKTHNSNSTLLDIQPYLALYCKIIKNELTNECLVIFHFNDLHNYWSMIIIHAEYRVCPKMGQKDGRNKKNLTQRTEASLKARRWVAREGAKAHFYVWIKSNINDRTEITKKKRFYVKIKSKC